MSTRDAISILAGPYNGNRDRWLANAAKAVEGVTFRTMRSLWHGEIKNDHLAAIAVRKQAEKIQNEKAGNDVGKLAGIYTRAANALERRDSNLHRDQIAVLVGAARILSSMARAGIEGVGE